MNFTKILYVAFLFQLLGACSGGGGSSSANGNAPTISSFSIYPLEVYVGEGGGQTDVSGSFNFTDPDGDLSTLTLKIFDTSDQLISTDVTPISGVSGITTGIIQGTATVITTTAGEFTIQVYVTDEQGNNSNTLETVFTIVERIWSPVSTVGSPDARTDHTAVWTGSEMLVWGGDDGNSVTKNTGGKYNPSTDRWGQMSTNQAPSAREQHTAIWTGTEMIIWGGLTGTPLFGALGDGARYNPQTDTWSSINDVNQPSPRVGHTAIWTGSEMIIWGGFSCIACANGELGTGARYNPSTDTWHQISTTNAPASRGNHSAIWTGTKMVVWGGENASPTLLNTGGIYDPATDTWTDTTLVSAPSPTRCHISINTTSEMIIFGGQTDPSAGCGLSSNNAGYRYDFANNVWAAMNDAVFSSSLSGPAAVWSGDQMITWFDNVGGRYAPTTDTWKGISIDGAPSARRKHTLVWTGTKMIVWGGEFAGPLGTGAIYNPLIDPTQ